MEATSPSPPSDSPPPSQAAISSGVSADSPSPQNENPSPSLPHAPPSAAAPLPAPAPLQPSAPPASSSPPPLLPSLSPPAPPLTPSPSLFPPSPASSAPPPSLPLVSPPPSSSPPSPLPPSLPLVPLVPPSLPSSPPLPELAPPPSKASPLPPSTPSPSHSPSVPNLPVSPPSRPSAPPPPPPHLTSSPPPPHKHPLPSVPRKSAPTPANISTLQHPPPSPSPFPLPSTLHRLPPSLPLPRVQPPASSLGSSPTVSSEAPPTSLPKAVIPSNISSTKSSGIISKSNSRLGSQTPGSSRNAAVAKFCAVVGGLAIFGLIALILYNVKTRKRRKKRCGFGADYVGSLPKSVLPQSGSAAVFYRHMDEFSGSGSSHSKHRKVQSPLSPHPLRNGSGSDGLHVHMRQDSNGIGYSKFFSYQELSDATDGFSAQNILGQGGFGCVYKGRLPDGREVAVKQLKVGSTQGEREFRAEVEIISRIHHRHLVSLVGYCIDYDQKLLVYEYVPNNTLDYHLHGEGRPVMDWKTRIRVAAGAARGIAYLHEDCHPRIIHRDIKSSNILLDSNFEAQVSDFGLAKLTLDADSHVTTRVMGTFGYLAPEYASSGKLTDKSDVFSFGVVLLELVTGRKPVDTSQPLGDESLVEWARPLLQDALESTDFVRLADPRLENKYVGNEMFRMIEAAAACIRHSAELRPRMGQVARAFNSEIDASDLNNGMKPGQSRAFDNSEISEEIRRFKRMAFGPVSSTTFASEIDRDSVQSSGHH